MQSQEPQLAAPGFYTDNKWETIPAPPASEIYQRKRITLPSSLCKPSLRAYFDWDDTRNDDYANRPALLDLFAGGGGAAMGYYLAGFRVVGVDIKPQKHYPFEFHEADAMTYPLDGFDVIHASPPCQGYSTCTPAKFKGNHKKLIPAVREKLAGRIYVIENVPGARRELINPLKLCGSQFNLPIRRHRYFEINPELTVLTSPCQHRKNPVYVTGSTGSGSSREGFRRFDFTTQERRDAMDCQWMTGTGIDQAIPPAYTEWIGRQLIVFLGG